MNLSPASPNVGYFILYPKAWWEDDPYLGTSGALTRSQAAELVAHPDTIATADIYGFDWSYAPSSGLPLGAVTWTNLSPEFFVYPDQIPTPNVTCDWGGGAPYDCAGWTLAWFSAYAGGGTNTPEDPDGGVNALLVEVTATDPSRFTVDEDGDYLLHWSASSDGGQGFLLNTFGQYGQATPLQDVLTRLKVWRLPTRIWPTPEEPPAEFWTSFVGAHEIV